MSAPPPRPYSDAPRLPLDDSPLDLRALLPGAPGGLELEIGPGRGGFIVERLAADPAVGLVGLEIRRKWATIVDERLRVRGHAPRARVFSEDVREALPRFPAASLRRVYVHFPDPWWKKRHQKRLVVTPELLAEVVRVLEPGGELLIQTDVEERAAEYERVVAERAELTPVEAQARAADHALGARSPRERQAMARGLPVVRLYYRRVP